LFEDLLLSFWLPLVVKKRYKHVVGYLNHEERESITRSRSDFHGQLVYGPRRMDARSDTAIASTSFVGEPTLA
jgi:hypothetical protein